MDRTELDSLKAELRRMQARIDDLESSSGEMVNRRGMLRGLGAAAVGAAGGLAFARPAAADDGDNLVIGNATQTANSPTLLIRGAAYTSSPSVGLLHVTDNASTTDANVANTSCITAAATNNGLITAFAGSGTSYGAKLDAPVPLKLLDSSNAGPPGTGGYTGQLRVDDGDLWFCVDHTGFGSNAKWRKLAGVGTAGSYHPVTPARVHDSRPSRGGPGPLATGSNRTISVANSINTSTGAVVVTNFVPANATAIAANVTVVGTAGNGFLAANPGGVTTVTASTLNWTTGGQTIANGITLSLNTSRQLTLICGGGTVGVTATDVLVDVFGYYL